ncbi:MAG: PAS domain S-box protein [Spirulina sp.]
MTPDLFYGKVPEILVADDSIDSLGFISQSLSSHGYDVRSVTNGTLALASVREAQPDLILLDIKMPDLSGYEVCRKLKQDPQTQEIPIIFISALHEPFDKIKAFDMGGVDYITKPFYIEEVLARIQSQLERYFSLTQIKKLNDELEKRVRERTEELTASNRALHQEIADRQQIEKSLRESEAKFRQLSEHIQEVFWLTRYNTELQEFAEIEYISPAFITIWGRNCESLYENPWEWSAAIHPDDRHRVEAAFIEKAARGDFDEEYRILRPDGTIRWIRDRGFPVYDEKGRVYRVAGIAEDITELKHAEETSRLLASVVESSDDAIITKNLEGTITSWNAGAVDLFGYSPSEAIGQNISMLVPPDREEEESVILDRLKKGERIDHLKTVRLRKDSTPIDVSVTINPLKDATGKIVGASKIIRDISDRKREELERDRFWRSRMQNVSREHRSFQ